MTLQLDTCHCLCSVVTESVSGNVNQGTNTFCQRTFSSVKNDQSAQLSLELSPVWKCLKCPQVSSSNFGWVRCVVGATFLSWTEKFVVNGSWGKYEVSKYTGLHLKCTVGAKKRLMAT